MKKFAVVLLLIVSMLTLSLSACARGGDDVNDGNDYDDEVVTIVVGIKADSTEKAYLSAFSKAFNRVDKSIKISVQTFADYQQAMNNYIATDSMPDIVWCTGDYHAPYSSTGHYEDLTPYFERDGIDLSKYYKTSIDSARLTIDPKAENYKSVWFMPRDYNRLTIMYNKDIFDKAKMEYPMRYAEGLLCVYENTFFEENGKKFLLFHEQCSDEKTVVNIAKSNNEKHFSVEGDGVVKIYVPEYSKCDRKVVDGFLSAFQGEEVTLTDIKSTYQLSGLKVDMCGDEVLLKDEEGEAGNWQNCLSMTEEEAGQKVWRI